MTSPLPMSKDEAKGFFAELFDFSFRSWVTLRVAGVLYGIVLALVGLGALVLLISSFTSGEVLTILLSLLGVPLLTFVTVLMVRIGFEGTIATIAIARNTEPLGKEQS